MLCLVFRPADVSSALACVNAASSGELFASGMTSWEVRTAPRAGSLYGVRATESADVDAVYVRLAALAKAMGARAVVAGWTAAVLAGVPARFIDGTANGQTELPLCVNPRGHQPHRRGVKFTYSGLDDADIVTRHGVSVTRGVRTTFDCIRLAPWTDRGLAWADACIRFGLTTPDELAAYAEERRRWPGIRRVRELIPMLSPFAESPMESVMRYEWIGAGLPQPLVNPSLYDQSGRFIARVDLLDEATGLVGEYDGTWHREGLQPWKDATRERLLRPWGLTICKLGGPDFNRNLSARGVIRSEWLQCRAEGRRPKPELRIAPQTAR
jgi:hypothetical protein